jgi:hypothetical protein
MSDLSQLSDAELTQRYLQTKLSSLSDDELRTLHTAVASKSARDRIESDAITKGAKEFVGEGSDALFGLSQAALNLLGGAVRGAGSIGATLARPFESAEENAERRKGIDENMKSVGAQPDSTVYQGGKLAAEVGGTAAAGGILGKGAGAVLGRAGVSAPVTSAVTEGLSSGGFRVAGANGIGAIAARVGTGAATGGASAAMVNPEDAGIGAAIGGVVPVGAQAAGRVLSATGRKVASGIGAVMQKIAGQADPEVRALAEKAETLGIKIPADRLVDSKVLDAIGSSLNYIPLSGRSATERQMVERMNQAASRLIGEDTSNLTKAVRNAQLKLGEKFGAFLQANGVMVDRQFIEDLADVATQANRELGADSANIISKQIDAIAAKAIDGEIEGPAAYAIKRGLDRISGRSTPEAFYAGELKRKLMGALERSVGEEKSAEFALLRQQYGTMLDLERLVPNGARGEISAAKLAGMKDIGNQKLQDLADIAQQFIRQREGMHGAAQRVYGGIGAGATAAAAAAGIPGGAAMALGAGALMAGGRAANKTLNSEGLRDAVLQRASSAAPALAAPAPLGRIATTAVKAMPIAGAAASAGAAARPQDQGGNPAAQNPQGDESSGIKRISEATNINEAIAAAGEVVSGAGMEPRIAPNLVAAPTPAPQVKVVEIAPANLGALGDNQPSAIWTGRRGGGYQTPDDALRAMASRQRLSPELDWRIEKLPDGHYRLAGYESAPEMTMNNSGTLTLSDPSGRLRKVLANRGIPSIPAANGRLLIGRGRAQEVQQLLRGEA